MISTKRALASGFGTAVAAAAAFTTLATGAASANSDIGWAGITVPAGSTGAPAGLVASLEAATR